MKTSSFPSSTQFSSCVDHCMGSALYSQSLPCGSVCTCVDHDSGGFPHHSGPPHESGLGRSSRATPPGLHRRRHRLHGRKLHFLFPWSLPFNICDGGGREGGATPGWAVHGAGGWGSLPQGMDLWVWSLGGRGGGGSSKALNKCPYLIGKLNTKCVDAFLARAQDRRSLCYPGTYSFNIHIFVSIVFNGMYSEVV